MPQNESSREIDLSEAALARGRLALAGRRPDADPDPGGLEVRYEPVADLVRRCVSGVAAVGPDAASREGLRMLEPAVQQAARWHHRGLSLQLVAELSAGDVAARGTSAALREMLEQAQLPPECLMIEVEESGLAAEPSAVAAGMRHIAALGAHLCLSGFGSGNTSVAMLRRLPLAAVKADAVIVAELGLDRGADAVIAGVARVADAVGVRFDAAGVDTPRQRAAVAALGCGRAQGRAIGASVSARAVAAAVDECDTALAQLETPVVTGRRRRPEPEPAVLELMMQMYGSGASLLTIAAALNRAGSPHPEGIRWHASAVGRYVAAAQRALASSPGRSSS